MSELSINTTQNVNINFTAASVGERLAAYFIDLAIKISYCLIVYGVFFYWIGINGAMNGMDQWSVMAIILLFFFPIMIYSITLESLFEGQSFGKKIIKIKVVKIDGYQASFGDYLIRWFFRLIDITMMYGLIGLITVISNKKNQRLGDMTAGTAVITLKSNVTINSTILEEIGSEYVPVYPLVIKLSDNDMRIIKDNFQRARAKGDYDTVKKLRDKIESVTGIKNRSATDVEFIRTILKDYNFYTQNM
ncbi:RDD family protein [Flavobacterium sp. GT3R68]|uniref:RDD family protein n=1 Tax=Flavobacterium sp. GT3R68 TaxID=2594437 RepID=UPI000F89363D|nr:RDD family protein [Flavobacterium sp. GT3R68]RTY92357.1 RDD family protein [Flavobacterium sp. GSN2]TRW92271.1 RDD family protein [Flavobacterium sp. GT3R68]